MAAICTHLSQIEVLDMPASVDGCEDCLREQSEWLHLRMCLTCGHVGCCDDSPRHHASDHARESGHALLRSLEPGEEWTWCFEDQIAFIVPEITGTTRIPPSPLLP